MWPPRMVTWPATGAMPLREARSMSGSLMTTPVGGWFYARLVADVDAVAPGIAGDRVVEGDVRAAVDLDAVLLLGAGVPGVARARDRRVVEHDVRGRLDPEDAVGAPPGCPGAGSPGSRPSGRAP